MDATALFKISYGLFVAAAEYQGELSGCVINTAAQVTDIPCRMIAAIQKESRTAQLIRKKESLALSVLSLSCPMEVIKNFGYRSSRDADKFAGVSFSTDGRGNPWLRENTVAFISCKVYDTVDLGTHWLFLCDVEDAGHTASGRPMTYADYRDIKAGKTPAEDSVSPAVQYVCTVCHYVYDGGIPFEELPDDYLCPVCKKPKSFFRELRR